MGFVMSRWPVMYHQLSRLLDFPFKNFVPHTARPSLFYVHALALIKKYKLTSEQLYKSSLHQLHRLLTPTPRPHFVNRQMWHSIHSTVFTNTLRTFNYRSIFEILPLLTKNTHHTWTPDLHAAFAENYQKSHHTPFFHAAKLHRFGIAPAVTCTWKLIYGYSGHISALMLCAFLLRNSQ